MVFFVDHQAGSFTFVDRNGTRSIGVGVLATD